MVIIKIGGVLVNMFLDINLNVYGPYSTTESMAIKKLIAQCLNAIYGNMVKSLLYYCNFFKMVNTNKVNMNPYDPCVVN